MSLLAPATIGVLLFIRFLLSYSDLQRFLRISSILMTVVLVSTNAGIAITYNRIYHRPFTSNYIPLAMALLCELLLFIAYLIILRISLQHHIVILEDSRGRYYAIGTVDEESAKKLIRRIVVEVMASA